MNVASKAVAGRLHLMAETLRDGNIDMAESMYLALCEECPPVQQMLIFPVLFRVQRGHLHEALQFVDSHGPGRHPELRALCLRLLEDPTWQGEAEALLGAQDPVIAQSMQQLLGRTAELQ